MHSDYACRVLTQFTVQSQTGRDLDVSQTILQSKAQIRQLGAQNNEVSRAEPRNPQNSINERPIRNLRLQGIKSSPPISDTPIALSTSQFQLPSTVPDSQHARMAISASQSQGDTQPLSQGAAKEFASRLREQQQALERSTGDGLQSNGTGYND